MQIAFTKGAGKYDRMTVLRDGVAQGIDCPKQRIIPHDMVHYAVESTLRARGFLTRVREGEAADMRMAPEPQSDGVERLVEVFQGDAWSGGESAPDAMLELYQVTCRARGCPPLAVDTADIEAVRACMQALDRQWQPLAVGGSMTLDL